MKTRQNALEDKFMATEMWAHRGNKFVVDDVKTREIAKKLKEIVWDLFIMTNTDEESGRKSGWWE